MADLRNGGPLPARAGWPVGLARPTLPVRCWMQYHYR